MKRVNRKRDPLEEGQINLTPLIDVVFVILIMFIVVAPLLEVDRITLATSAMHEQVPSAERTCLSIHVYADNTIRVNGKSVTIAQIGEEMQRAYISFSEVRPQLFHDKNASFGIYQAIKNAAEKAGFKEMDILLKPE